VRLTVKQLQYFAAVARTLHFGRAATACAVSQPALSVQIQDLETHLGVQLIERSRSGIKLTRHGEEVARRAERILSELQDLEGAVGAHGVSGSVRLGVIPTIAPYLLPAMLRIAAERHPDLELRIQESQTGRLVAALSRGDLDVLLLALPIEEPGLVGLPLFEDRFMLAAPADMVIAAPVALGTLPKYRLLLLEEGHCLRDQAFSVCQGVARESLATLGASSLATLIELVAAGQGVTLVPRLCSTVVAANGRVRLMPLAAPEPSRTIGLVWRRSSAREQVFDAIAQLVCAAAAPTP
jgi:LysR family hydrogen peroxide-inducible transcriptional activator